MELWMGANPIEGRDLENARQMLDFMRRYGRVQAA